MPMKTNYNSHLKKIFDTKKYLSYLLPLLLLIFVSVQSNAQGTWSTVSNTSPNNSGGLMLLLSDGTMMAKSDAGGGSGVVWMKLTPNSQGSYINGTWSTLSSMINDRLYFSSQVLKDGRVYVAGGEYGAGGSLGEIYNPLNNTWTQLPDPGHRISDANSEILPDGRVLQALVESDLKPTTIYDPISNQYTAGPSTNGIHNESAWVKLPDNSILYVDRLTRNSERYIPSQNRWVTDSNLPVDLYDPYGDESGGSLLLPDGRAFFIGSSGMTAYYTPSGNNNPGSWSAGPNTPNGYGCPDGVASIMPNGKILLVLSPPPTSANHFPGPTFFYEFDYRNNSFTNVSAPDGSASGNYSTYVTTMLNLPNGSVMYSVQGSSTYYIYTPSSAQLANGKAVIGQITANDCGGSSYTISGTGFNGMSEGTSYGDDWQMATNYPIIRLTNGSNVYYARTYNWNSTGVQTGSIPTNAQFTLPPGLPYATYSLVVTANGISSDAVSFTPSTCNGLVNVYKDCNYGGYTAPLAVGNYTTAQLNALGVLDNDVSSLKVTEGYKVILYDGDNFTGSSTVITSANSCLVAANWNDITSSIQVRTNGAANLAGIYFLQNRNSGLYMDIWGISTADGANISQGGFNGGANQQFQFNHLGDGTYQILATHSMKSMDVNAISTADGANVQQWTYNGTPNQQFIVFPTGDGYYKLIPKHSGKLVEVAGASTVNGANVQQYTNNNQTCGMWGLVVPIAANGNGDGLTANYFNGMNFDTPVYSRKDATINFDWGTGSPNASVNSDQFSARWTGQIEPRYSGIYTFYLNTDNGRRLWINNQLVVDKWIDDWGTEYTGTILLTTGQKYDIRVEYFEDNGGANCKMEWSSLLQAREVVPQSQLYSNALPSISITSPANNASFTAPAAVAFNVAASDANGSVSKVDYYNGTNLIGTSTSAPFSYMWSNVSAGNYSITSRATDNLGGVTVSTSTNIVVKVATAYSILIQAEAYTNMLGVQTEATTDVGGTLDVGWIDTGDWMAYYTINFPTTGAYTVQYRVASVSGGQLSMDLNAGAIQLGTATIPATGGWQNWTTITQTINVTAGTYNVGIFAQTGGWNINWFTITSGANGARIGQFDTPAITDVTSNYDLGSGIEIYPNPLDGELRFISTTSLIGGSARIINAIGVEVVNTAINSDMIDVSSLSAGMYTLLVNKDGNKFTKKFIKR